MVTTTAAAKAPTSASKLPRAAAQKPAAGRKESTDTQERAGTPELSAPEQDLGTPEGERAATPEQELASALVRTMHLLQDFHAESSRPLGLTPQQAHLLCVLLAAPLGMTELSGILSIERSSLTSMVDRLERRDLVTRTTSPTDRRACLIELTDAGRSLAHDAHDAVVARIESLTATLPASTRRTLTTTLQSLLNHT